MAAMHVSQLHAMHTNWVINDVYIALYLSHNAYSFNQNKTDEHKHKRPLTKNVFYICKQ